MEFLKPDRIYEINGVTVKDFLLTEHKHNNALFPGKKTKSNIGITIHNSDDIKEAEGTTDAEQYVRSTVNGNMGGVFVQYYVDDREAWHCLPDDWVGWHARDGLGNGNTATIAIEIIGNSPKAEENGARLAAGLLAKYGLTVDNLYTHTHWLNVKDGKKGSREFLNTLKNPYKNCPAYILPHWAEFEAKVAAYMPEEIPDAPVPKADKPNKLYQIAYRDWESAEKQLEELRAKGVDGVIVAVNSDGVNADESTEEPPVIPEQPKKSVNEIAREVIIGKWGAGEDRKKRLTAAGYDYDEVQAEVRRLLN